MCSLKFSFAISCRPEWARRFKHPDDTIHPREINEKFHTYTSHRPLSQPIRLAGLCFFAFNCNIGSSVSIDSSLGSIVIFLFAAPAIFFQTLILSISFHFFFFPFLFLRWFCFAHKWCSDRDGAGLIGRNLTASVQHLRSLILSAFHLGFLF